MSTEIRDFIVRGPVEESVPVTETIGQFYLRRLEEQGDDVLLLTEVAGRELSLTSAEVLRAGKIVAAVLHEQHLQQTDTVMISCGTTLDFMPVMMGAFFAGVAVAPVSPTMDRAEFQHIIDVIRPRLILGDPASLPVIKEVVKLAGSKQAVMALTDLAQRYADEAVAVDDFRLVVVDDPVDHVDLVMPSSGTTGRPKGVEYTGHSLLRMLLNMMQMPVGVVVMTMSGPFWASGVIMQTAAAAMSGKLILLPQFTEKIFLDTIQKYQVNFTSVGPDQITALAKWPLTETYDLSSLLWLAVGGARVTQAMQELAEKKMKLSIVSGYGMTESFMGFEPPIMVTDKPGTVGTVAKNCAAKIVDVESGEPLGPNLEGELCYRAPTMLKSYRGNPEATRALFDEDGFIRSGDIAYYDDDGYFYVIDRIKELIKYKLIHVYPIDIEEVLLQHDGVQEAAVVGIQNVVDTEHSTAFVVRQRGSDVTAQELVALVQERLPVFKWLHGGVYFLNSLPRTASGKVQKRQLRAMHAATSTIGNQKL